MRVTTPLRLAVLPAIAALVVVLVARASLSDLAERDGKKKLAEESEAEDPAALLRLTRPPGDGLPASTLAPLDMSEPDALARLEELGDRAALAALWPDDEHGELLHAKLVSPTFPAEGRLYLLGRFAEEDPARALSAARLLAREEGLPHGILLYAAYEILAHYGEEADLALLAPREFERPQTVAVRETRRRELRERLRVDR